jgi:hypothetical protein
MKGKEKTVIKALSLLGGGGLPCAVDTRDGKIIRIRPLHYDWKYSVSALNPWPIKNGLIRPIVSSIP